MKNKKNQKKADLGALRLKAEDLLKGEKQVAEGPMTEIEVLKLMHELAVHEIELEMQQDELLLSSNAALEAAEKYAELFDFAPSGYYILNVKGEIVEVNLSGALLLGKERAYLINSKFVFFVSNDSRPVFNLFLENLFNDRSRKCCYLTLSVTYDSPLYVHITGMLSRDGTQCLINALDVTELRLAKEALVESEKHYYLMTHSANDAIISINSNGNIVEWNQGAEKIFGYTKKEIVGKQLELLIPKRYTELHERQFENVVEGGEHHIKNKTVELSAIHKNGDEFPIELSVSEWETSSGKFFTGIIRDISERTKAFEEIKIKENNLQNIISGTNVGAWEWNVQTGETVFNERWANIIGYSHQEIEPTSIETWMQYIHPDDLEVSGALLAQHFSGKLDFYECEARMRHKNGDWVWILDRGKVISWNEDGKPLIMTGFHMDITARKLAEEELKQSEARFRNAIEAAPLPVMLHADDGEVLTISHAWTELTGYTLADIPTISAWTEKAYGPGKQKVIEDIDRLYDLESHRHEGEYEINSSNGSKLIWDFSSVSLGRLPDGRRWVMSMASDITLRKKIETELEESEFQYRTLANTGSTLVWKSGTDKQGYYFNDVWLNFTGRSLEQELGNGWAEGVHPDDLNRCLEIYNTSFDKRETFEMEGRLRHVSGQYHWLLHKGNPNYNRNNEFLGYIGNSFDISNRKQAEMELIERNEELQRFHSLTVGRELAMIELKKEINELLKNEGREAKYIIVDGDQDKL